MLGQLVSLTGAGMVLVAYAGNQMGRLEQRGLTYLLLNLAGGGILTFFALRARDPGLILMEGSWVAISVAGLLASAVRKRKRS